MSELPVGWEDAALEAANLDMSNDESPRFFAKIIAIRTANRLAALQAKRIAELEARLAQVEGDAGRYQWLRKGSPKSNRLPHITQYPYQAKIDENRIPQVWDIEGYHPDRLDAAIDAAMKEQK